jgi:hypothetical protein
MHYGAFGSRVEVLFSKIMSVWGRRKGSTAVFVVFASCGLNFEEKKEVGKR